MAHFAQNVSAPMLAYRTVRSALGLNTSYKLSSCTKPSSYREGKVCLV